ncbi:ROK family protein [Kribbella flavida DSM 17836]|uniref:ROK family protein n=1 Tax=Kribbella flavida (strain DSM 17836 / JCM 10339 / NBRC 14399) TaxID=479435 RepID=D2PXL7_KRIFD|nr:ROK family transcriptional regulator [Kribbella flavida]ADB31659.1 ROK family protein [Kribbella flavida DSM 17836]
MPKTSAATPPLLRRVNAGKLLGVLSTAGAMTGTGLIEATGLTRATVHAVCNDLIAMGWVVELEPERDDSTVGRPSRRFEFNSQAGYVLGIDVGAGKTTVLVANLRGETLAKAGRSFAAVKEPADRTELVDAAVVEAMTAAGVSDEDVIAAGVGVAAPVDRAGNILAADEFWRRFDTGLTARLSKVHGWPALLENDANLAVLGEHWRGEGQGVDDLVVLLASERFGSGLMDSGRLLHGSRGGAGEMLYLKLVEGVGDTHGIARIARERGTAAVADPAVATLLRELALEAAEDAALADEAAGRAAGRADTGGMSGGAWAGDASGGAEGGGASGGADAGGASGSGGLASAGGEGSETGRATAGGSDGRAGTGNQSGTAGAGVVTAEMVFRAAAEGDAVAAEILGDIAVRTARVVATVGILFNPELVVLGGAVAEAAKSLLPSIEQQLSTFTTTPPQVAVSSLGDTIVSVGAVRHALNYVEQNALDLTLTARRF